MVLEFGSCHEIWVVMSIDITDDINFRLVCGFKPKLQSSKDIEFDVCGGPFWQIRSHIENKVVRKLEFLLVSSMPNFLYIGS